MNIDSVHGEMAIEDGVGVVVVSSVYPTTPDDLWQAVTSIDAASAMVRRADTSRGRDHVIRCGADHRLVRNDLRHAVRSSDSPHRGTAR